MRKILMVIAIWLLAGCGGGSSSSSSSTSFIESASVPTGMLKVTIASGAAGSASQPLGSFAPGVGSFAPGNYLRIVMRNEALRTNGQPFSAIQDTAVGNPLDLSVPVANGYTVEALSYNKDSVTGLKTVLSYAMATNVSVDASGTSTAALALTPVTAALVLPPSILQGSSYSVFANLSSAAGRHSTPLNTSWFLNTPRITTYAPFVNRTSATVFAANHSFQAPWTGGVPTDLYFQGVFTIKPTLLNVGESAKQWLFNCPEVSMPISAPINLIIVIPDF